MKISEKTTREQLGFTKLETDFSHPKTKLFVEFPARTLAIGEMQNVKPDGRLQVGETTVHLYSPTPCVMDRLAAFYHWNDAQGLEQTVMVAKDQKIDLKEINRWSKAEGEQEKFERFRLRIAPR